MDKLIFRKVRSESDSDCIYCVIDTCENIQDRHNKSDLYKFGFKYFDCYELPFDQIDAIIDGLDICPDDVFSKLNMHEYLMLSAILKKNGFVFNRKEGKLINKKAAYG